MGSGDVFKFMNKTYAILPKISSHLRILVFTEVLEPIPVDSERQLQRYDAK